jgi:hypothetical protein
VVTAAVQVTDERAKVPRELEDPVVTKLQVANYAEAVLEAVVAQAEHPIAAPVK